MTPTMTSLLIALAVAIIFGLIEQRKINKQNKPRKEPAPLPSIFGEPLAVEKSELWGNGIAVSNEQDDSLTVIVEREQLYVFLEKNGYLAYTYDYNDPRQHDGHGQETGSYSMEQYFEAVSDEQLANDVRLYLKEFCKQTLGK